jgi:Zn-dependent M16 (insulinase) family peptidase
MINTPLRAGLVLENGFEILELVDLTELESVGIWARHRKSGAEVFHVFNEDKENLFAFAFATAPEDSTGAAHILEHSVLCGSERYPLKDAFLVLAQGSLQTFLNAWTFPDKTLYPASSVNERDYFNLMSVYGDAVFRPLLSEWTFMQEGCRYELLSAGGPGGGPEQSAAGKERFSLGGVVYNEMKGVYSSQDAYAGFWSSKAVLPGTPYAFESGGDPDCIPDLTWERLREFHRTWYVPANCRVFLAGNIPTEKQLDFLNDRFFSCLPPGKAVPAVPKVTRWEAPRFFRVPCPSGAEQKATVFLSWICSDITDTVETLALGALAEILLGHDGSPLFRALIESGLGEDLSPAVGLESEIRETLFVAGLRGVAVREQPELPEKIAALILGELGRLVSQGILRKEIDAALLSMEFSHREIRRSGGPFSLVWMRRSLKSWFHGGKPWDSLLFVPALEEVKRRIAAGDGYFESLIKHYLLDNPHRALVVVEPEDGYLEKKEAALVRKLMEKEAALSEEERRSIKEKAAMFEKLQNQGDSPEALATIPHLSRRDLSVETERIPRKMLDAGGTPLLAHELFTNGISYVDLAFPLDIFSPEDYPWFPFFSQALVSMGLPGMDYGEVASLLARTAGGFYALLQTGVSAQAGGIPQGSVDLIGRDWIVFRLKALDEKTVPALDLALRLITEADLSDTRRLRDLVVEMKNDVDASLAPSGHSYASGRSSRHFSRARAVEEIWNGLEQVLFVHHLAKLDTPEISRRLIRIRDTLLSGGLIAGLTGSGEALAALTRDLKTRFGSFGPPRARNSASQGPFFASPEPPGEMSAGKTGGGPELYSSPSLQVGFAAVTLQAAPFATREHAAELVLTHQLSTSALWEEIRMKGGAYGAFASSDALERAFCLSTYRDPDPTRSLEVFPGILEAAAHQKLPEEVLEKAVIGTFGRETRPRTNAEKGFADFGRFLCGIEDYHREAKLRFIVDLSADELAAAADRLVSMGVSCPVIITGTADAEKAAAKLGTEPKKLPL